MPENYYFIKLCHVAKNHLSFIFYQKPNFTIKMLKKIFDCTMMFFDINTKRVIIVLKSIINNSLKFKYMFLSVISKIIKTTYRSLSFL